MKHHEEIDWNDLIGAAMEGQKRSYSPYSGFPVGAALVTGDGTIFAGCNIENASYGLAICAERNAICQAIAAGHRIFRGIAIVASPLASPCGACRQFIAEFGNEIQVMSIDSAELNRRKLWRIAELLPDSFRLDDRCND